VARLMARFSRICALKEGSRPQNDEEVALDAGRSLVLAVGHKPDDIRNTPLQNITVMLVTVKQATS